MIDRKNSSKANETLIATAKRVKQKNLSIYMFPEGTRSRGKGILRFKTGAFRLAQATGQAIVPIICSDTSHIRMNKWDNGTVIVDVMAPRALDESLNPKESAKYFEDYMKDKYIEINQQAKQASKRG